MNNERFFHIMQHPGDITPDDRKSLYDVIKVFPNFQTAHALLLYNLYYTNKEEFDQQLRVSAMFVSDRKVLFNFLHNITGQNFEPTEVVSEKVSVSMDDAKPQPQSELLEFDETLYTETEPAREVDFETTHTPLGIIEPGDADIMEFVDEEKDGGDEPAVARDTTQQKPSPMDLISKFIDENPAFTPNRLDLSEHREDISLGSIEEPEELATETLALIYTSQKLFDKAVTVYEKLILKFPEKSTYFASRIEDLKKNIK